MAKGVLGLTKGWLCFGRIENMVVIHMRVSHVYILGVHSGFETERYSVCGCHFGFGSPDMGTQERCQRWLYEAVRCPHSGLVRGA